jgi:hypothetical protein
MNDAKETAQLHLRYTWPWVITQYSQTSVHDHKGSRMTYYVSSYEHASRQHRGAISWEYERQQYS